MSQSQTQRLWQFLQQHPNETLDMPTLNRVCAGPGGVFCASWTRRASSVRRLASEAGGSFEKVRDEWVKDGFGVKHRFTWYRYTPPTVSESPLRLGAAGAHLQGCELDTATQQAFCPPGIEDARLMTKRY